jgi:pilus assembly protein Flp/PilA
MKSRGRAVVRGQRGQGMSEYIIIVALIAISAIAVITIFSQNIRSLFAATANELAGSSQTSAVSAGGADQTTVSRKRLSNFGSSSGN